MILILADTGTELGQLLDAIRVGIIVERGFDPVYGARPLKRAIQQELENPLARRILAGEFGPDDTVVVDAGKEGLAFAKGGAVNLEK